MSLLGKSRGNERQWYADCADKAQMDADLPVDCVTIGMRDSLARGHFAMAPVRKPYWPRQGRIVRGGGGVKQRPAAEASGWHNKRAEARSSYQPGSWFSG